MFNKTNYCNAYKNKCRQHKSYYNMASDSKSVWYHTDALFVGFRVVRPREIPSLDDVEKFWPSEEDIKAIPSR